MNLSSILRSNVVGLKNLARYTSITELKDFFSQYGRIWYCRVYMNEDKLSRQRGCVAFKSEEEAEVVRNIGKFKIDDAVVEVDYEDRSSMARFNSRQARSTDRQTFQ